MIRAQKNVLPLIGTVPNFADFTASVSNTCPPGVAPQYTLAPALGLRTFGGSSGYFDGSDGIGCDRFSGVLLSEDVLQEPYVQATAMRRDASLKLPGLFSRLDLKSFLQSPVHTPDAVRSVLTGAPGGEPLPSFLPGEGERRCDRYPSPPHPCRGARGFHVLEMCACSCVRACR
jgi:hypothetical protein